MMASVGVVLSTFIVGTATYYLLPMFGFEVGYLWCLVFGSLISPTDPVAVLGILKNAGAPKTLETKITGESLFNDGVGVVVYLAILGLAVSSVYNFVLSDGAAMMGEGAVMMTAVIWVIVLVLFFYARAMAKRGVLR